MQKSKASSVATSAATKLPTTQAQPQVNYSKELVLGVEIVVEDFNFESQVLLMRTNLDLTHIERRFRGIFNLTR